MKGLKVWFQSIAIITGVLVLWGCNINESKVIDAVRQFEVTFGNGDPYQINEVEATLIDPKWSVVFDDTNKTYLVLLSGIYDNGDITHKRVQELWFTVSSDFKAVAAGGTGDSHTDLVNTMILIQNWPRQIKAWKEAHK